MKSKLESIREESLKAIREAVDLSGLDALRVQYLGKKAASAPYSSSWAASAPRNGPRSGSWPM